MLNRRSAVNVVSSLKECDSTCFTVTNYKGTPSSTIAANNTLTSDTKKGVLGGSVAGYTGGYLVGPASLTVIPCGLFVSDALPDNFMNAPAVASNKVGVAQFFGEFEIDVFETHAQASGHASVLSGYTIGAPLFASGNGLLTCESAVTAGGSTDYIVGRVTWTPVNSNLILGIDFSTPYLATYA